MSLINEAFADSGAASSAGFAGLGGNLTGLMPILLIFVIFYFMLIRPQQKKLREHKEMVKNLKRGDKVITSGGIVGTVQKADAEPDIALVEIAPEIQVKIVKSTISEVIVKPEK